MPAAITNASMRAQKYGTQHSMVGKYQLAVSLLAVTVRAVSQEPLLFMAPGDVSDAWGLQYAVASQATDVSGSSFTQHPGLLGIVEGGLLPPNPTRGGSDLEIFFTAKCADCNETSSGEALYYMTTRDFSSYSNPVRVAQLPVLQNWHGKCLPTQKPCTCKVKSLARTDSGRRYVILTIGNDAGVRPMVCDGPDMALDCFRASTSDLTAVPPSFYDHDDLNLIAAGETMVDFQITFQDQPRPLRYCDNIDGVGSFARCDDGYRRVATLRTSRDGFNWTDDAACPGERWFPGGDYAPFDPQFRKCAAGWHLPGMLVPDAEDPPELEFYKLYPARVGNTSRTVARVLLYAPAPQAALGPDYGMQHAGSRGPRKNSSACSQTDPDLEHCHGPHMGVELWIGPPVAQLTTEPLSKSWQRPFRRYSTNRQSLVKARGTGCPHCSATEMFTKGGVTINDTHVWVSRYSNGTFLLGVPLYRIAGLYAPANAEFTTPLLTVGGAGDRLWLNADAHWTPSAPDAPDGAIFANCDEGCAAYIMVALLDAVSGQVVANYEKEKCRFLDADGQRLLLSWDGRSPAPGSYRLRVFYRDAVIYAAGVSSN